MTKQTTILVVEDDEWLATHHVRVLTDNGYKATSVPHAFAAIDAIDTNQPDVLIVDVFLAGPNGFVLLHELQSHDDLADIPVILCTNVAKDITEADSTAYGIHCVLDKTTMTPHDLLAAVRKVRL